MNGVSSLFDEKNKEITTTLKYFLSGAEGVELELLSC
jgi:hypothetical protein